ncbi:Imm1 family immunity protein [Nocardia suismassiliense]|uniref:Imm1 family immunity protein n=1 Tax=Nocardia suismassiliense TaxID=2077092 RepID=UPI000D1D75D0|nr:Imm1 family immunity protein [Nocardia suismassiliense]
MRREPSIKSTVEVSYLPQHRDDPITPESADELVAVIDDMVSDFDLDHSYMMIILTSAEDKVAVLNIGILADKGVGSMEFQGDEGGYYSKGVEDAGKPVFNWDFGNPRFFPGDSRIEIESIKQALVQFYETGGSRPENVDWQEWSDETVDW